MSMSEAMKAHLNGVAILATLVRIVARSGRELCVTDFGAAVVYQGRTYLPSALTPSQIHQSSNLAADNGAVTNVPGGTFTTTALRARVWSGAAIEINIVSPLNLAAGPAMRKRGFLSDTAVRKYVTEPQFMSLAHLLDQPIGYVVRELCDVVSLGDDRCGVDLTGLTEQGVPITLQAHVTAKVDQQQFTVAYDSLGGDTAPDDNFYLKGKATFTSGDCEGFDMEILTSGNATGAGTDIVLFLPMTLPFQDGDTLALVAGCDRTIKVCRDRFANGERNRSYFMLPGRRKLLKFPEGAQT
jgi:uncharacterized phage protein (TIGR02218 family)